MRYIKISAAIIITAGLAAAAIVIGIRFGSTVQLTGKPDAPVVYGVTYRLSGTAKKAVVTSGEVDVYGKPLSVNVPWQTFKQMPTGSELYLSARNDTDTGAITCEIIIAGKVIETSTHEGAFKNVACITHAP